jgi:hypothetical protein
VFEPTGKRLIIAFAFPTTTSPHCIFFFLPSSERREEEKRDFLARGWMGVITIRVSVSWSFVQYGKRSIGRGASKARQQALETTDKFVGQSIKCEIRS